MSIHNCSLCGKNRDIFELHLTSDDGEKFSKYVCGTCWEIIAQIARLALSDEIKRIWNQIYSYHPEY